MLTTVDQGLLSTNAQYTGFKNRLINGQVQIWQRGTSFTTPTADGYTADRWQFLLNGSGGTVTVSQGTTNLPPGNSFSSKLIYAQSAANRTGVTAYAIRQLIEMANIYDAYSGGTWTLSFWYRTNRTGTNYVRFGNDQGGGSAGGAQPIVGFTVNSANTWEYESVQITVPALTTLPTSPINTVGGFVDIGFTVGATGPSTINNGDYFEIAGVQLEKGATATSFDYRPYGTELALCQRYYEKSFNAGTAPANGVISVEGANFSAYYSGGGRSTNFQFKQTKRVAPSVTLFGGQASGGTGVWGYYNYSVWVAFTSSSAEQISDNQFRLELARSGSFTNGLTYLLDGNWVASAEL